MKVSYPEKKWVQWILSISFNYGDFPGGPEVRTQHFSSLGHGFDPWSGIKL